MDIYEGYLTAREIIVSVSDTLRQKTFDCNTFFQIIVVKCYNWISITQYVLHNK
jgi:hypothetical protein